MTIPGKSRKKIVKAPDPLWSFSNNTLAFQMVEILLKRPKMMPPRMSSIFLNVVNAMLKSWFFAFFWKIHHLSIFVYIEAQLTKGECDSRHKDARVFRELFTFIVFDFRCLAINTWKTWKYNFDLEYQTNWIMTLGLRHFIVSPPWWFMPWS